MNPHANLKIALGALALGIVLLVASFITPALDYIVIAVFGVAFALSYIATVRLVKQSGPRH
jgi:hypothetical protein